MKPLYWLFLFWLLIQALYFPTWNAGFVTDFTGLLERLDGRPASGILTSFGFPAQQQVLNFFLYLFYHAFGASPLPWYLLHTAMHAVNGWLLYRLTVRVGRRFEVSHSEFAGITAALLFLLLPYQSEVVVWRVCFNYLLSTALLLGALHQLCGWLDRDGAGPPYGVIALFTLTLFTFELAFAFPLISLGFLLVWPYRTGDSRLLGRKAAWVLGPQILLIGAYFLLNRLTLGAWIGHYGAETHLGYSLVESPGRLLQYSAKLLGLARYYPHPWKEALFSFLMRPAVALSALTLLTLAGGYYLLRVRRLSPRIQVAGLFFGGYLAFLLPVLPLFFQYLLFVENDRHSYLASAFLLASAALLLSALPRGWKLAAVAVFLLPSAALTWQTNQLWRQAAGVYNALLDHFPGENQTVYLLNLPDNLQGVALFRDYGGQAQTFLDALRYLKHRPFEGELIEVASYNLTDDQNGVDVTRPAPDSLVVTFRQWGNWWWRDGQGAADYETEAYRFRNLGHHYELKWKNAPAGAVLLVQDGAGWKELR